jgi:hypothetical protein
MGRLLSLWLLRPNVHEKEIRETGGQAGEQSYKEIRLSHLAMHEVSIELERMEFGLFHVLPGSSLGRRASCNFELSDPLPIRGRRRLCLVSLHGSKSPPLPLAPWTSWYASSPRNLNYAQAPVPRHWHPL